MSGTRHFLGNAIASGLECEIISPDDLLAHVSMDVLANNLPVKLKAQLLTAALKSESMDASLVLDTLGIEGIVENIPAPTLWKVVAAGAKKALGTEAVPSASTTPATSAPLSEKAVAAEAPSPSSQRRARKPNARAPRARAGATSRPQAPSPVVEEDVSAFDVDTRVGAEQPIGDFDVMDEINLGDDVTAHGRGHGQD